MIKDGIMVSAIKTLYHHPQLSYKDMLSCKYSHFLSSATAKKEKGYPQLGDS